MSKQGDAGRLDPAVHSRCRSKDATTQTRRLDHDAKKTYMEVGTQSGDNAKMRLDGDGDPMGPNLQPKTTCETEARKTKDAMD